MGSEGGGSPRNSARKEPPWPSSPHGRNRSRSRDDDDEDGDDRKCGSEVDQNRCFVAKLTRNVDRDQLYEAFERFGTIDDCLSSRTNALRTSRSPTSQMPKRQW